MTTTSLSPAQAKGLVSTVTSVPGVRGVEPSITSAMHVVRARVQGRRSLSLPYGIIMSPDSTQVSVEVSLDGSRPVKEVVSDLQQAVRQALAPVPGEETSHPDKPDAPSAPLQVTVRVQSLG